jgi:pseudaminic acid biosynthesis-associated methylase
LVENGARFMSFKTEQENFWAGEFGNNYIERNRSDRLLASNLHYFCNALRGAGEVSSLIEFGANVGMNIRALQLLYPNISCYGVEINTKAASELRKHLDSDKIFNGSILDFESDQKFDVAMTKGVLIHINPEMLGKVYEKLYQASKRYILVGEYYNPSPVSVSYRGNDERLFKRDFCGEMLDQYPDLRLVDCGFSYKRHPAYSQDDITWFLIEKR